MQDVQRHTAITDSQLVANKLLKNHGEEQAMLRLVQDPNALSAE